MDIEGECGRRIGEMALDVADAGAARRALVWGMGILSESRRFAAGSGCEVAEDPDGAVGEKWRSAPAVESPSRKFLRVGGDEVEMRLEEFLKMVESGGLGEWMSGRVASRMRSADCVAVVRLIDHCLLLSLDQTPTAENSSDQSQNWLPLWMAKEIMSSNPMLADPDRVEFPTLDWLLAYLTAARPEIFLPVLLHELLHVQDPAVVHYARQAAVFEFAALSAPDLLASSVTSLFQTFEAGHVNDKVRHWIVQAALCPNFLRVIARALASGFNYETAKLFWTSWLEANPKGFPPLPAYWISVPDMISDANAWGSILIIKHFESLSSIATEVVQFLYEVNPVLLDWLNTRLSLREDSVKERSLFLQELKANVHRLYEILFSRYLLRPCGCSASLLECRKCNSRDPFLHTCQIALLQSEDGVVAEVLARATVNTEQLQVIVRLMHVFGVMCREQMIFKIWADSLIERLKVSDSDQVLNRLLAIRQLADPLFWESHVGGTAWKPAWKCLCDVLNHNWLKLLPMLHKEENRDVSSVTLGLLLSLSLEGSISTEMASEHLKGALGLFLQKLRDAEQINSLESSWVDVREIALLRKIIVELASYSAVTFAVLVTVLFDFSFEACSKRQLGTTSTCSCELSKSVSKLSSQMTVSLAASKLDRYGKLKLLIPTSSNASRNQTQLLSDENCCRTAGGVLFPNHKTPPPNTVVEKQQLSGTTFTEVSGILIHTFKRCMGRYQSKTKCWLSHPAEVLARLLVDRLETPYELSMSVEQYEEILPKHVVTVRHAFLIDLFRQNPLLFTALEIVMEHRQRKEVQACTEFVRALLADAISQWHCSMRSQQALNTLMTQDTSRMQVYKVIQLVNSAHWLPQPLASCGEIISLIRAEDVTSLLFIIWRCMHDNLKAPSEINRVKSEEGALRDWRGQFLGILRHNISRIGAHFARLYPQF